MNMSDLFPGYSKGLCRGADPHDWFSGVEEDILHAKAVCMACPVQGECLDYVLNAPVKEYGVWAGLTDYERDHGVLVPSLYVTVSKRAKATALR